MDETEDKLRRNLVVASTVILLLAWFEVPVAQLASRLSGAAPVAMTLEYARLWWAAGALLLYFTLRFWHSFERAGNLERWKKHLLVEHDLRLEHWVRSDLARFSASGAESGRWQPPLGELVRKHLDGTERSVTMHNVHAKPTLYSRLVQVDVHGRNASGEERSGREGAAFELAGRQRWRVRLWAVLKVSLFSKVGMELVWPLLLAAGAAAVVLVNLWHSP